MRTEIESFRALPEQPWNGCIFQTTMGEDPVETTRPPGVETSDTPFLPHIPQFSFLTLPIALASAGRFEV